MFLSLPLSLSSCPCLWTFSAGVHAVLGMGSALWNQILQALGLVSQSWVSVNLAVK